MHRKRTAKKERSKPSLLPICDILLFAILVLIGNVPLWFFSKFILPYREWMASLVAGVINLSGLKAVQNGVVLFVVSERWMMSPECIAITAMIVFTAFIIAYPSSIKLKGIALFAGLPFLFWFVAAHKNLGNFLSVKETSRVCGMKLCD